jgi:hypothetical protein
MLLRGLMGTNGGKDTTVLLKSDKQTTFFIKRHRLRPEHECSCLYAGKAPSGGDDYDISNGILLGSCRISKTASTKT